ncbi:arsenical pump-driving ATPase [Alkalicoccus luteus]|uniref:Arsenical pump-driving ATPase n=1 Tax=Alkalicoccus luteus TaxID=1237094 RepID=A0A969PSF3_9BACI|nr:arsenical pump-driving ATPase [Alkalicoccus luteus]
MNRFDPTDITVPYLFLTGKGGVGKTSTAAAMAVTLAEQGKQVLIVSTDPASNLQDVFDMELEHETAQVPGVPGLSALNLDPEEAAAAYRERVLGPYRDMLPQSAVESMEEQMSGACTVEIAAFDEFTQLLTDKEKTSVYDHIIFDTAPTGHTLRLLQLPQAWTTFLDENEHGASCLGPVSGLASKREQYAEAVRVLGDPKSTKLILVARPDHGSLAEASRAGSELGELGINSQHLLINGVFERHTDDDTAVQLERGQQEALEQVHTEQASFIPLKPHNVTGLESLRSFFGEETALEEGASVAHAEPGLDLLAEDLGRMEKGVIMTMGKGGTGKTSVAAATASALAASGRSVHLTTTDPAAHVEQALGGERPASLTVSAVDPKTVTKAYKENVLAEAGAGLSEDELAFMKEDLDSPCTEEIAIFQAFAEIVDEAADDIVVIDTAPTGHTLLLLDAAESYHREVERKGGNASEAVQKLLPRLRDPEYTKVLLVSLPEATPVLEGERLQQDLERAGITPAWWILNQSFSASETKEPLLMHRAAAEQTWISRVKSGTTPYVTAAWNSRGEAAGLLEQFYVTK